MDLVRKYENVVIARTFSKGFGVPSIRLGYLISNADNMNVLSKTRFAHESNALSNAVAEYLLDNYHDRRRLQSQGDCRPQQTQDNSYRKSVSRHSARVGIFCFWTLEVRHARRRMSRLCASRKSISRDLGPRLGIATPPSLWVPSTRWNDSSKRRAPSLRSIDLHEQGSSNRRLRIRRRALGPSFARAGNGGGRHGASVRCGAGRSRGCAGIEGGYCR